MGQWTHKYDRTVFGGALGFFNTTSSANNQWFGSTVITSQFQSVTAPLIGTGSRIFATLRWLGPVASGTAVNVQVASFAVGSGFYFVSNSIAFGTGGIASVQADWFLTNATGT